MPTARQLAAEFSRVLRTWLTDKEFHEITEKNRDGDQACCATHEYCDPNQAMLDAMEKLGMEYDPSSQKQTDLTNLAWDIAKRAGFLPGRCEAP